MEPLDLIKAERARQIQEEGFTVEHDDLHTRGEMALAAAVYATTHEYRHMELPYPWPWDKKWYKPEPGMEPENPNPVQARKPSDEGRIKELVKAGALIVAEIERIQRTIEAKKAQVQSES